MPKPPKLGAAFKKPRGMRRRKPTPPTPMAPNEDAPKKGKGLMKLNLSVLLLCALSLFGCATTEGKAVVGFVTVDFTAARDNFTAAGMPMEAACMQKIIDKIGIETGQDLQVRGLASLGSVAYIEYSKLYGSQQAQIPNECYVIVGKVTTAVGKRGAAAFSGGIIQ